MKTILITIVMLLCVGCGQDQTETANPVQGAEVMKSENLGNRADLIPEFNRTCNCMLNHFGISNSGSLPKIKTMSSYFICGGTKTFACTVVNENTIYIADRLGTSQDNIEISHETIHWITSKGNDIHDSQHGSPGYFNVCSLSGE